MKKTKSIARDRRSHTSKNETAQSRIGRYIDLYAIAAYTAVFLSLEYIQRSVFCATQSICELSGRTAETGWITLFLIVFTIALHEVLKYFVPVSRKFLSYLFLFTIAFVVYALQLFSFVAVTSDGITLSPVSSSLTARMPWSSIERIDRRSYQVLNRNGSIHCDFQYVLQRRSGSPYDISGYGFSDELISTIQRIRPNIPIKTIRDCSEEYPQNINGSMGTLSYIAVLLVAILYSAYRFLEAQYPDLLTMQLGKTSK